jgi:hypothetical protein
MINHRASPYAIRLEGKNITVREHMLACQAFLVSIEDGLGGEARVVACCRAWSKWLKFGSSPISDREIRDAHLWQQNYGRAINAAKRILTDPESGDLHFSLSSHMAQTFSALPKAAHSPS